MRRHVRFLALALALWMSATVAAAALSPLLKKADIGDFAVLCSSAGMKLVSLDADGKVSTNNATHNALDCPGCLSHLTAALPPVAAASLVIGASYSTPDFLSSSFASREALTASARGPPVSLLS